MSQSKPRVLMISLEKGLLKAGNLARKRIVGYGDFLERLDIVVFGREPYDVVEGNVHIMSTDSGSPFWYVWDALRIVWKLRREKYDVVTAQDVCETGLVGYFAAKKFKARFAAQDVGYFFHGDYFARESFLNRLRSIFGHWLMRRADAVRVMSKRTEEALVNDVGVPREHIVRFPFGVDAQFFAPIEPLPEEDRQKIAGRPYFVMPARFVPIKRFDVAIEAFAKLAAERPEPLLVLVGRGPLENDICQWISDAHLESRTIIVSWTQSLAAWYRGATATLMTSDREGYGMTALESLICGTPVIITDVGCAGEVVKDGENGYVVPVGAVDALAERMQRILDHMDCVQEGAKSFRWETPQVGMKQLFELALIKPPLRLLFITQVVDKNDPILGFVIRWIQEFANQGAEVTVYTRRMVTEDLPAGVFGRDMGQSKIRRILNLWRFSIADRKHYDAVFVHMTPQLLVLGWLVWATMGKRVYQWYMHRSVSWWLKTALKMCRKAFTGSDLSLRVDSPKKTVVGHGIDTEQFKPIEGLQREPVVLWVSRIHPRKHLEESLEFMAAFKKAYPEVNWTMRVIGTAQGEEKYLESCKQKAIELGIADRVKFEGPMRHDDLPRVFASAAVMLSNSQTGSLDKVVLEALASGTPVLAKGEEYSNLAGVMQLSSLENVLVFLRNQLVEFSIDQLDTRSGVVKVHALNRLVKILINEML